MATMMMVIMTEADDDSNDDDHEFGEDDSDHDDGVDDVDDGNDYGFIIMTAAAMKNPHVFKGHIHEFFCLFTNEKLKLGNPKPKKR